MTIKSQVEYVCPQCSLAWLPYAKSTACPQCGRLLPASEATSIVEETLQSARFNKKLYNKFELEYWFVRRLGDRYLSWGFKALDLAVLNPQTAAEKVALGALMELDVEEMAPYREHLLGYLVAVIEGFRFAQAQNPEDWVAMPEPEKPFFGRKIIED